MPYLPVQAPFPFCCIHGNFTQIYISTTPNLHARVICLILHPDQLPEAFSIGFSSPLQRELALQLLASQVSFSKVSCPGIAHPRAPISTKPGQRGPGQPLPALTVHSPAPTLMQAVRPDESISNHKLCGAGHVELVLIVQLGTVHPSWNQPILGLGAPLMCYLCSDDSI